MINLIDADLIAYPCSASCEPTKAKPFLEERDVAIYRLHDLIQRIVKETNTSDCEFYIGGEDNFRKQVYPAYKGNRVKPHPTWLQDCREVLVTQYNATIVNGMETDDMLGIRQTQLEGASRICSIDKDLLMVPGNHYNWRHGEFKLVSPLDGLKTFYKQLIAGDGTDNIPSFDGKTRNSVPKFVEKLQAPIDTMTDEVEMWKYVLSVYEDVYDGMEVMHRNDAAFRNAQLIYILRKEGEFWRTPGQKEDDAVSS